MAQSPIIRVRNLSKTYVVPVREAGIGAALKSLVQRKTREVNAVDDISFEIEPGEMVGFLGPNGAGKTTTLKMLSGLLHPSGGECRVLGFEPFKREKAYLSHITLVMGQRNQLAWDIPAADSYNLNRAIYRIPQEEYQKTLKELVDLLDLSDLITKPVRNLSLGERMKVEIAGSLLHRPKVLFLDEPTIGLDVTAQRRIREFLKEYNARHGASIMLTSHYMADVEALAKRVIVIHHGKLIFDGELGELARRFNTHKTIIITSGEQPLDRVQLAAYGEIVNDENGQVHLRVQQHEAAQVTARLLAEMPVTDVSITDPPIENAIERIFATPNGSTTEPVESVPVP
ncbi:MAG: ATP-binding cassette domain-containing protein [Anaerolineae bacterium]